MNKLPHVRGERAEPQAARPRDTYAYDSTTISKIMLDISVNGLK